LIARLGFRRKKIQADGLVYIGKEANNIEDQPLNVPVDQVFIYENEIKQKVLDFSLKESKGIGTKYRSTLKR